MTDGAPGGPRVAVIVPCHNDGELITDTLDSVRAQEPTETVIVDDASTEPHTRDVLQALSAAGATVLRHECNRGLPAARMTGLQATRARFVFPLDSDDLLVPGSLTALADLLDGNPDLAVAYADYEEFGDRSRVVRVPARLDPYRVAFHNDYPVSSMFRREALAEVGGWQDVAGLVGYEDWNLWMSLAEHDQRGRRAGDGVVALRRRIHGNRMLGDAARRHRELYGHLRRLHPELFADIRRHRGQSDLPPLQRAVYPRLYGGRPPLGIGSRLQALRERARLSAGRAQDSA